MKNFIGELISISLICCFIWWLDAPIFFKYFSGLLIMVLLQTSIIDATPFEDNSLVLSAFIIIGLELLIYILLRTLDGTALQILQVAVFFANYKQITWSNALGIPRILEFHLYLNIAICLIWIITSVAKEVRHSKSI